jgi:autophagy-related protein 18
MEKIPTKPQNNHYIKETILYMNFNQDSSCICIGTETGFHIYNSEPFKNIFSRST